MLAGRETFVGLRGSFGTARIGHFLSPYDEIQPIFGSAPTLTTSILSTGALWAQAYLGPPTRRGLRRPALEFDPLRHARRSRTSTRASSTAPRRVRRRPSSGIVSFGGFYDNGPLQLGFAYEVHHKIRGTRDAPLSDTAFSIAGGYQFEGIRLGGVYERLRYDATPSTDITRDFYGLGVTIDAGPGLVFLYWGHAGNGKGSAADGSNVGGLVKGESTGSTQWEVSYTYVLSARTWLYGGYVKINNQSNASYTFDSNLYPVFCNTYPNGGCGKPGGFVAGCGPLLLRLRPCSTISCVSFDRALRTLAGHPTASRPTPGANLDDADLTADERRHAAGLMRVNHTGEVCAQALYAAQALVARDPRVKREFAHAAREEEEHLAWTQRRLEELQDRPSLLNPLWYAGSFAIGLAAGVGGDRGNLGFVARDRASGRGAPHRAHGAASRRRREEPRDRRTDARRRGPTRRRRQGRRCRCSSASREGPDARRGRRHAVRRLPRLARPASRAPPVAQRLKPRSAHRRGDRGVPIGIRGTTLARRAARDGTGIDPFTTASAARSIRAGG